MVEEKLCIDTIWEWLRQCYVAFASRYALRYGVMGVWKDQLVLDIISQAFTINRTTYCFGSSLVCMGTSLVSCVLISSNLRIKQKKKCVSLPSHHVWHHSAARWCFAYRLRPEDSNRKPRAFASGLIVWTLTRVSPRTYRLHSCIDDWPPGDGKSVIDTSRA